MSLPKPVPGLVISYSYLWSDEHKTGVEEGRKNRPCAIVAARRIVEGHEIVTVFRSRIPLRPILAMPSRCPRLSKLTLGLTTRRHGSW